MNLPGHWRTMAGRWSRHAPNATLAVLAVAVILCSVSPPVGYILRGYLDLGATMQARLNAASLVAAEGAASASDMWTGHGTRLRDILTPEAYDRGAGQVRVLGPGGDVLQTSGQAPRPPAMTRTAVVSALGAPIGALELTQSLRPVVQNGVLLAVWTGVLSLLIYLMLRAVLRRRMTETTAAWRRSHQVIEASPNAILVINASDPGEPIVYVNPAFERATGHVSRDLLGRDVAVLFGENAAASGLDMIRRGISKKSVEQGVFQVRRKDGIPYWNRGFFVAVGGSGGDRTEYAGILDDVTNARWLETGFKPDAWQDGVTGLASREMFLEYFYKQFDAVQRGGRPFAVLFLDLDHFRDVNETLGPRVGDALLQAVGQRLRDSLRATDVVARVDESARESVLARFGGDEFAILQVDLPDAKAESAGSFAARLQQALSAPFHLGDTELHVTTSIGIALYSADLPTADALLTRAELALYRAKAEGRNRFCFYSADLDRLVQERVALTDEMRTGLSRGEFELYYQPQVEIPSGRIIGLEALIRWNHPRRGLLMPDMFIPMAEMVGLIAPLGRWVIDATCRQISEWAAAGLAAPKVSFNVSAAQFGALPDLEKHIFACLRRWNVRPEQIEMELTETVLMARFGGSGDMLKYFCDLGITIALDDFGTGYSSLRCLSRFQVSRLKVATEFVQGAVMRPKDAAIVRASVELARALGIEVIAEGAETRAQVDFLLSVGCDRVQGFYHSRPVSAAAAGRLVRQGSLAPATAVEAAPLAPGASAGPAR